MSINLYIARSVLKPTLKSYWLLRKKLFLFKHVTSFPLNNLLKYLRKCLNQGYKDSLYSNNNFLRKWLFVCWNTHTHRWVSGHQALLKYYFTKYENSSDLFQSNFKQFYVNINYIVFYSSLKSSFIFLFFSVILQTNIYNIHIANGLLLQIF